jgi:NADP-dependent 3-hydroxy acid dehydrogenase YdfG
MTVNESTRTPVLVTGAGSGFGRAAAASFAHAGAKVIGVARDHAQLQHLHDELGDAFTPVHADAADPHVAGHLIDAHRPRVLLLNAGATPLPRPLQQQTWQTFSLNWDNDVKHAFHWTREALLAPLDPGSIVIAISSGAALRGSPLSGGYAGAKAAIRFITAYAADESTRDHLGITFISLLPQLTPATSLGQVAVTAYAARHNMTVDDYLKTSGPALTTEQVGDAILSLTTHPDPHSTAYLLTPEGLSPLP